VMRSDDAGITWQSVEPGLALRAMDPADGDILYATSSGGAGLTRVWKSIDRGDTWARVPSPNSVVACPSAADLDVDGSRLYVACSDDDATHLGGGVAVFDGSTWTVRDEDDGLGRDAWGDMRFTSVAADPVHDGVVYAGQFGNVGPGGGIWRSTDYGVTWTRINGNLGSALNVWGIAVSPHDGAVHLATDYGSYRLAPRYAEPGAPMVRAPLDDDDACTTDTCDPVTGPIHTPVSAQVNPLCTEPAP